MVSSSNKSISLEDYSSSIKLLKKNGFSDAQIAKNTNSNVEKFAIQEKKSNNSII